MASMNATGDRRTAGSVSATNFSWRNPPPEKSKKFGIVALGDDFEPTPQEEILLEMYDTIKAYEKHATSLRKDAALRKLQARNADFENKRKTRRKPKKASKAKGGSDSDQEEEEEDNNEEDESDEEDKMESKTKYEKREAKLQEWRDEVEEAKAKSGKTAKEEQEKMIAEQLADDNDDDGLRETVLTKKRKTADIDGAQSSLLFNMKPDQTPQHDFSSNLELESRGGKFLFPKVNSADDDDLMQLTGTERKKVWEPPEGAVGPNDGAFLEYLDDFDVEASSSSGNNTVAIKFEVPQDSRRFSFNIAQSNQPDRDFESILFHFNPRQRERGGQVVMNDKEDGIWGQNLSVPLSQLPVIFGKEALTLQIQIHQEGFDVFIDDVHCARLEHRQDLLSDDNNRLCLQFPSTDDYSNPENWKVFKVWWGFKPIMAKSDKLSSVPGVNSFNSVHPRKLFLRGLPKIIPAELDIRRAEIERAFAKYGGSRGLVKVVVYARKTFATVELESEGLADLALQEMSGAYQINRARRTKHEALQEERLAKEQAGGGGVRKDRGGWD